jgi:hypothetical protein
VSAPAGPSPSTPARNSPPRRERPTPARAHNSALILLMLPAHLARGGVTHRKLQAVRRKVAHHAVRRALQPEALEDEAHCALHREAHSAALEAAGCAAAAGPRAGGAATVSLGLRHRPPTCCRRTPEPAVHACRRRRAREGGVCEGRPASGLPPPGRGRPPLLSPAPLPRSRQRSSPDLEAQQAVHPAYALGPSVVR